MSKIVRVRTLVLDEPLDRAFCYSQAWYNRRAALIVVVETNDGTLGLGECFGPARILEPIVREAYAPELIGVDPFDTSVIWDRLYNKLRDHGQKGLAIEALSGLDIALWDIKGHLTGLPVSKLLGGRYRERVPVYATGLYPTAEATLADLVEEAAGYVAAGFGAVKAKVGFGLARDITLVRALRQRLGPDIELMVDANHAYDAHTALRLGRELVANGVLWFEEPVPPEDIEGYVLLRRSLDVAIAGGEAEFTCYGMRRLLEAGAVDILQPDPCATGGLTESLRIAQLAHTFNVRCLPHVWGTRVALAAGLQFLAAIPDTPASLNPIPPLLEFDMSPHPFREAVVEERFEAEAGTMAIPARPGLGVTLSARLLREAQ